MRRLCREVITRWRALFRKRALDRQLDDEIRFHLQMETELCVRQGMARAQAERTARLRFGSRPRTIEQTREARGAQPLEDFMQDLKYSFRMLIKNPAFTLIAMITLALGIGAVTVIFSVVNGVLLQPLPFDAPEELMLLWAEKLSAGQERYFTSPQEFSDWREQNRTFSDMAAFWPTQVTITETDGGPSRINSALATENLFRLLGARPAIGRVFTPEDGDPGAPSLAILSWGTWQRRFGGDRAIVGSTLTIDDTPTQIVGVLDPAQAFPENTEIWTNINFPLQVQSRFARWMSAIGRIKPGETYATAQDDLDAVAARLAEDYPQSNQGWTILAAGFHETLVGDVRPALLVLLAATGLILVIACANVANLLLSRSETRAREIAVRTAFGASKGRLARQLLTESLVLAGGGALLGLLLTMFGLRTLQLLAPDNLPRIADVGINGTVLGVTLVSTLFTGFFFGLAPVVRLLRSDDLLDDLKEGTKGSKSREGLRLQNTFVVAQLALALILVVGSGLLIRSFANLRNVDPGFRTSGLLTFEVDVPQARFPDNVDVGLFYDEYLRRLRDLPGVEAATAGSSLPLRESLDYNVPFTIVDRPAAEDVEFRAYYRQVDPAYFDTMGVALVAGKSFDPLTTEESPGVVMVNRTMAEQYWPDSSPINEGITNVASTFGPLGSILIDDVEIIGVVEDIKYGGLKLDAEPSLYFPVRQAPFRRMTLAVRTSRTPDTMIPAVKQALASIDPGMPISNIETIENIVAGAMARDRFSTLLLTLFGGVALALATVGIYGVLSFAVAQRLREIGIRMALGAGRGEVVQMILRDGAALIGVGLALGLVGSFALSRLLSSQLYGVSATDLSVYVLVALVLSLVATAASYVPARRATRADPMMALRAE